MTMVLSGTLKPFADTLHYVTTTIVHPTWFPYPLAPTLHAARISIAYQANARKSPTPLSWGTYLVGYLIMCWGGGFLSHTMLGLPPPMLYSYSPWINYITVHLLLTALFYAYPSLLHPPTFDTISFPLDAVLRTNAIIGTISMLSVDSPTAKQINTLYKSSSLTYMILGALASAGGGMSAATLGTWSSKWKMNTPTILRADAGFWSTLDFWGGSLVAAVYGIAIAHPAFSSFIATIFETPLIREIVYIVSPEYKTGSLGGPMLSASDARALGAFILTVLFGLRVYKIHWDRPAQPETYISAERRKQQKE